MTTPKERTRAVLKTRQPLVDLANSSRMSGVPETIRQRAETLLRYYPEVADLAITHNNCPHWFGNRMRTVPSLVTQVAFPALSNAGHPAAAAH
jgi:hypothetical protein